MNSNEKNLTQNPTQPVARRLDETWAAPPVDIYENQDEYLLVADLPGVKENGVHIHYERGLIELEARREEEPMTGRLVAGQDLRWGYRRSFSVPGTIDVDKINAALKSGVLFLKLPKSEAAKPKQIPVRAG
ncbi:MAG: Hsp20/alpha crystallin family protein [Deltaproteobacteria bacterium]|nr:Hsp20/alpha crystallin family protein [Deltaproteobacteria bacterium]